MTGIELIAKERQEQIEKHGRSIDSDVLENSDQQLAVVASIVCYPFKYAIDSSDFPDNWDVEIIANIQNKSRIGQLSVAGALIAAEIDRINALKEETT